jgi:hypothetical protein
MALLERAVQRLLEEVQREQRRTGAADRPPLRRDVLMPVNAFMSTIRPQGK